MQNRITWDPDEMIRLLENQLDRLKVFRFDSRYRSLLGEGFTELLARWEKDILSRRDDPFTLVICGEFKRGKSSLINALLGEDVTPVNVTAETVTLNRISYGPHSNEAVLSGGKHLRLSDEEMQRDHLENLMRQSGFSFRQTVQLRAEAVEMLRKRSCHLRVRTFLPQLPAAFVQGA